MRVVHFKKSPYTTYIGRPSVFGNPHALGYVCPVCEEEHTRAEAVLLYEQHARETPRLLEAIRELPEDAVLGCWCAPRACHGDVIVKLWKEMHGPAGEGAKA
jgi:hypothetical protein